MNNIKLTIGNNPMDTLLIGVCVRQLSALAFNPEDCSALELAVVEAVNNSIEHAYGDGGQGTITVSYSISEEKAEVEIIDQGVGMASSFAADQGNLFEFDPEDLHNLPEKGMGIWLIRSSVDKAVYQSGSDGNRWILTKFRRMADAA